MKKLKVILVGIIVFTTISVVSCKEDKEARDKKYNTAYVCPMHCDDSGRDEEGTCVVCGMTLVKNEEHYEDGHTHD